VALHALNLALCGSGPYPPPPFRMEGGTLFQREGATYLKERPVSLRLELMGGRTSVKKEDERVERDGLRKLEGIVRRQERSYRVSTGGKDYS
jgi:hypothetical protein